MSQIVPAMTLKEAQRLRRCRICGAAVKESPSIKPEWVEFFPTFIKDLTVILNYGAEFAHNTCLDAWRKSGGVDLILSDKMAVVTNVGDIRKLIEDLPDSLPTIMSIKGRMVTPVFAVESRTELLKHFGSSALEIRDG